MTLSTVDAFFDVTTSLDSETIESYTDNMTSQDNGSIVDHNTGIPLFPEDVWNKHLWIYVSPVILVVGSIGNLLSILVFSQKGLRVKSTSVFLIMLALVDTVVLYTGLLRWWLSKLTETDVRTLSQTGCKIHIFITYTFIQCSAWILVAVTIERFISVFVPLQSRHICTRRRAMVTVAVIMICMVGLNAHFFWTRELFTDTDGTVYCVADEKYNDFMIGAYAWIDSFIASYIPFAVMLICNVAIIGKLVKASLERQSTMNVGKNASPKMGSMTAMLLTLNFIFLLTTSPVVIFLSYQEHFMGDKSDQAYARFDLAWAVVTLLSYCNNALNFFLYCISGARFRKELVAMVCRRRQIQRQQSRTMSYVMSNISETSTMSKTVSENTTVNGNTVI